MSKNVLTKCISDIYNQFNTNIIELIDIFITVLEKENIKIPNDEKRQIHIIITTIFNYNIVKFYTCSLYLSIVGSIILTTSLAYIIRNLNIFNE